MMEDAALHAVRDDDRMLRRGRCDRRGMPAPIERVLRSTFFVRPMVGDLPDFVQLRLGVDRPPRAVLDHAGCFFLLFALTSKGKVLSRVGFVI